MAIALADLLDEKQVVLDLRTRTLEGAVRKLVELLAANGKVREPDLFTEQILAREKAGPSAIEDGVAFPHARTDLVESIVLAIGRSRSGISFGAQEERAHLIFLIGVPRRLVSDYLVCLGTLARTLKNQETREQLLSAKTESEFTAILRTAADEGSI